MVEPSARPIGLSFERDYQPLTGQLVESLTRREREILALLASDKSNQEIADQLFLALSTVKDYNQQIFQKLGVNNRRRAILRARELGLLEGGAPPSTPRHNLPVQLTSFIGREKEIEQVTALLKQHRLVTLTGFGGAGKTRLALQVASGMTEFFKDGLLVAELTTLTSEDQLPLAILSGLGLRPTPDQLPLVELSRYYAKKNSLLILDNCEHLIEASTRLSETLLRACPGLRILATSRAALGISGENVYLVPSLTLPPPEPDPSTLIIESEAAKLFVERAREILPGFTVDVNNASAITQVCRRLDGIPLAIELAAARLNLLSVEEIALRLNDRFRLLTGGSRTALPKSQTLRGLIDWSWNLLAPSEKAFMGRLSVFSGGWSLQAAAAMNNQPVETLDLLSSLANQSLILVDRAPGQDTRYRMLETIRQYVLEKLVESGEADAAYAQYCGWFLALVEKAEPELKAHYQVAWLQRLELEHNNLRAALDWSLSQGDGESCLRLVSALGYYWTMRVFTDEYIQYRLKALELAAKTPELKDNLWKARVLQGPVLVFKYSTPHPFNPRREEVEEALRIFRALDDRPGIGSALLILSYLSWIAGDVTASQTLAGQSLAIMQAESDSWGIANCIFQLKLVAEVEKEFLLARELGKEGIETIRKTGDQWCLSFHLFEYNWQVWDDGRTAEAFQLFEENLQILRELGDRVGELSALRALAVLERFHGNFARSGNLLDSSLSIAGGIGDEHIVFVETELGELALAQGLLDEAQSHFDAGYQLVSKFNSPGWESHFKGVMARVCYYSGDYDQARTLLEDGLIILEQVSNQVWNPPIRRHLLRDLGNAWRALGDPIQAAGWYQKCLALMKSMGCKPWMLEPIEGMAKVAVIQGNFQRAVRLFAAAQAARDWMETPLPPVNRPDYERSLDSVRQALGEQHFTAAWEEGLAMPFDAMVAYALEDNG